MHTPDDFDPQKAIAAVVSGSAVAIFVFRKIREIALRTPPDPWPHELDQAVKAREAVPVCINCLYPQEARPSFCPHCAYPTGDYVTLNPYLQIFATGEVLRRGVIGPPEKGFFRLAFFAFYSLCEYAIFAPVYWFWMMRKASGKPICQIHRPELKFEETD